MPQPLNTISPDAAQNPVTWGAETLRRYPQLTALAMEQIAIWSENDLQLAYMLSNFMVTDAEMGVSIFRELRLEARTNTVLAVAKLRLNPSVYRLFEVSLRSTKASRSRRDEFAHHSWGVSEFAPNALILADPRDIAADFARILGPVARGGGRGYAPLFDHGVPWDASKYFCYRENDLQQSIADAQRAKGVYLRLASLSKFNTLFFNQLHFDSACTQLAADPLIAAAMQKS